jgi:hypothetical protein
MSIGIREPGPGGNAPISLLPADEGGSAHPHSIASLVTSAVVALNRLRQQVAICNKTSDGMAQGRLLPK